MDGRTIKAVAQVSKTGYTYVFDRVSGEPVWPIEERPAPQSNVPGEQAYPSQPHPSKPPPFERQGFTIDDLIDFTPELRQEAIEIVKEYVIGPIFTPPIVRGQNGKRSTIVLPGASFPGASLDSETGILYVPSTTRPTGMSLIEPKADNADFRYVIKYDKNFGPQGLPLIKPPYRRITAIDLNKGEHLWQIPLGKGPTNHPALAHLNLPDLGSQFSGSPAEGGLLITKTLVITHLLQSTEIDPDADGSILVAFDKDTGDKVGEVLVDRRLHGPVMSYLADGRQYIAIAGGRFDRAEMLTFALPQ